MDPQCTKVYTLVNKKRQNIPNDLIGEKWKTLYVGVSAFDFVGSYDDSVSWGRGVK